MPRADAKKHCFPGVGRTEGAPPHGSAQAWHRARTQDMLAVFPATAIMAYNSQMASRKAFGLPRHVSSQK